MKGFIRVMLIAALSCSAYANDNSIPVGDVNDTNNTQQVVTADVDVFLGTVKAISDVCNQLAGSSGYAGNISTDLVKKSMPNQTLIAPSGDAITITNITANSYSVIIPAVTPRICAALQNSIKSDKDFANITLDNPCSATDAATLIYTYKNA